jgi:hypothetical protein
MRYYVIGLTDDKRPHTVINAGEWLQIIGLSKDTAVRAHSFETLHGAKVIMERAASMYTVCRWAVFNHADFRRLAGFNPRRRGKKFTTFAEKTSEKE